MTPTETTVSSCLFSPKTAHLDTSVVAKVTDGRRRGKGEKKLQLSERANVLSSSNNSLKQHSRTVRTARHHCAVSSQLDAGIDFSSTQTKRHL